MILFHAFKHHLTTVSDWITENRLQWNINTLLKIKSLGNSQLDFYTGTLTPEEIKKEIWKKLEEKKVTDEKTYSSWIDNAGGYCTITLSDESEWTLRYINEKEFVHIHPSRYAKHTLRLKANALKTCVSFLLLNNDDSTFTNETINKYRIRYLKLPPVNVKEKHNEIEAIYEMLTNGQVKNQK